MSDTSASFPMDARLDAGADNFSRCVFPALYARGSEATAMGASGAIFELELRPWNSMIPVHVGECHGASVARRKGGARDRAGALLARPERCALRWNGIPRKRQADEMAVHVPQMMEPADRLLAEVAALRIADPSRIQSRLHREVLAIDLGASPRDPRFDPTRVERCQPRGPRTTSITKCAPDGDTLPRMVEPNEEDACPLELGPCVREILGGSCRRRSRAREDVIGPGPLHGEKRPALGHVLLLRVFQDQVLGQHRADAFCRTGIDVAPDCFLETMDPHAGFHLPLKRQKRRVASLPRTQRAHVVRHHVVEECGAIGPCDADLAAKREIEKRRAFAKRPVLRGHVTVVGGDLPAVHFDQPGSCGAMLSRER
jgi:hypothetical protein